MPEIAYLNGEYLPIEKAMVPIEDRGYQFGDAVYEGIASYEGRLFYLEAHLDRLMRSMNALSFPAMSRDNIRAAILELNKRSGFGRAFIYIQISRGVASRNHPFPDSAEPQFIMTIREVNEVPEQYRQKGISAITVNDFRWGRCDIKTVQLLPNVIAKQKAIKSGAYDTIFVSADGIVREATSSNLFVLKSKTLITHPLTQNILAGITRAVVIEICKELNLPVEERCYNLDELYAADEAFLTGTTTEVLPIVEIDKKRIGTGTVGSVSKQLLEALKNKGRQET